MWCVTVGDCGEGQVHLGFGEGVRMWDHCEMSPPEAVYSGDYMYVCIYVYVYICVYV